MNFKNLKFRKLSTEKVLGHTTGFLLAIAVLSPIIIWRSSVRWKATLAIAIENERWDEALSIDPSNELAKAERSKYQIKSSNEIEVLENALTILYQAWDSGSSTEELGDIFATGNIKLAKAYSEAGEVKFAEDALTKAQLHDASDRDLSDAKRFVAKACIESARSLAQDGRDSAAGIVAKKGMGYDADVKIPAIVLEVLASDAVEQFKLSGTAQYRDAAVTAIERMRTGGVQSDSLRVLRDELGFVLFHQAERSVKTDPLAAAKDYLTAVSMGCNDDYSAETKKLFLAASSESFFAAIEAREIRDAVAIYRCSMEINPSLTEQWIAEFRKLPQADFDLLSSSEIAGLPAPVIALFSPKQLAQLSTNSWHTLPASQIQSIIQEMPVLTNTIGMKFKLLPQGTFTMGVGDQSRQVRLTRPFAMGVYEVTWAQYEEVMGRDSRNTVTAAKMGYPKTYVTWEHANEFCGKLGSLPGEGGRWYQLPTEAQWEYACLAGGPRLPFKTNRWGLSSMNDSVWEWCQDLHKTEPYRDGSAPNLIDPVVAPFPNGKDSARVARKSYSVRNGFGKSTFIWSGREGQDYIGFRVVVTFGTKTSQWSR